MISPVYVNLGLSMIHDDSCVFIYYFYVILAEEELHFFYLTHSEEFKEKSKDQVEIRQDFSYLFRADIVLYK